MLRWWVPAVLLILRLDAAEPLPPATLDRVTARTLASHVSFLASDALEGRATPSRGLDVAAEYIAAQFRRAGLETPGGSPSFFQYANWKQRRILGPVTLVVEAGEVKVELSKERFSAPSLRPLALDGGPVFRAESGNAAALKALPDNQLRETLVLWEARDMGDVLALPAEERRQRFLEVSEMARELRRLGALRTLGVVDNDAAHGVGSILIDPATSATYAEDNYPPMVHSRELAAMLRQLPVGETAAKASLRIPEASELPVQLKNVIGVLPGSDPQLKDSYILVTAHYDHVGTVPTASADHVYNGANDDASGVASLIEIAAALHSAPRRPRRTIVFAALFGEEKGLLGAYYYARNPLFPLARTIANINLEHMGRTDDADGPSIARLSATGFDFSTLPALFAAAARPLGVEIYKHASKSDDYFARSDNLAFAEAGIPAHTFVVAFEYPDYHGVADHWEKLDYENMAKVNRAMAAGLWELANRDTAPAWNETSPRTESYRKAAHGNHKTQ